MTDAEQKKVFSNNLKYYLYLNNLSQKDVAKAIDVSPQTFNTWCQGIALPRMGKIEKLSQYFNVQKSDLLDYRNTEDTYTIEIASMMNLVKRDEQIRRILAYLSLLNNDKKDLVENLLVSMKGDSADASKG